MILKWVLTLNQNTWTWIPHVVSICEQELTRGSYGTLLHLLAFLQVFFVDVKYALQMRIIL